MDKLILKHGSINIPAFFPDATRGAVRCVCPADLKACHVEGLVMNTFHLMEKPGRSVVKAMGGLHKFTGWSGPILTDSGGFQVFSLLRENPKAGEINEKHVAFNRENGKGRMILTPEQCIRSQFMYGADVMTCLDCCTHPDDSREANERAVDITVKWAKRCKDEYTRLLDISGKDDRPLLFGIIQGGGDFNLRRECAGALKDIGFDGYGFGGWPMDSGGEYITDILAYTAGLMPDGKIKYAMGIGKPEGVRLCHKMGYNLFDCVIPTREARHHRLYVFNDEFYEYFYPLDDKYYRDARPVSNKCDCYLCENFSRAYLRHLLTVDEPLGIRLSTIHNLRFYTMLTEALRRGDY